MRDRIEHGDEATARATAEAVTPGRAYDAHNLIRWKRLLKHYGSDDAVNRLLEEHGKLEIVEAALSRSNPHNS